MKRVAPLIVAYITLTLPICGQSANRLLLERVAEPNEKAFTILKPSGWITQGGIVRWDPVKSGGAANAIEAKTDFAMRSDERGTVSVHWLPDIYYVDLSGSYVAGMYAQGSYYNGMPVLRKMSAADFLSGYLVPYLHKGEVGVKIVEARNLPELEKLCYELDRMKEMAYRFSAAMLEYTYSEGGTVYRERAFCIVQDMGPYTGGMWKNSSTVVIRAPEDEFKKWEPLFHEIGASVELSAEWIEGELRGQQQRGNTMIKTMQDVARIGQEIQKGHSETNALINHQAYLNLTAQEDYVNPYTNEIERGSNQWNYRWVDNLGNVLYTDDEEYNPNLDINLNMDGFKKSPVKRVK